MSQSINLPIHIVNAPDGMDPDITIPIDLPEYGDDTGTPLVVGLGTFYTAVGAIAIVASAAWVSGSTTATFFGLLGTVGTEISFGAAAGPIGVVFAAIVAMLTLATGLIVGIVKAVKAANSTTMVIVNAIPGATLRTTVLTLDKGDPDLEIRHGLSATANDEQAEAMVWVSHGRTEGELKLDLERSTGTENVTLSFHNPLGGNMDRSTYSVTGWDTNSVQMEPVSIGSDRDRSEIAVIILWIDEEDAKAYMSPNE